MWILCVIWLGWWRRLKYFVLFLRTHLWRWTENFGSLSAADQGMHGSWVCRNGRGTRLRGSVYGQTVRLVSLFKRVSGGWIWNSTFHVGIGFTTLIRPMMLVKFCEKYFDLGAWRVASSFCDDIEVNPTWPNRILSATRCKLTYKVYVHETC
jgi:hypothetical protein